MEPLGFPIPLDQRAVVQGEWILQKPRRIPTPKTIPLFLRFRAGIYRCQANRLRNATLLVFPTLVLSIVSVFLTLSVMASRGNIPESTLDLTR